MKFVNRKKTQKVRIPDNTPVGCHWKTAHKDRPIELPEKVGKIYGFEIVEEVEVEEPKVEEPKTEVENKGKSKKKRAK